MVTCCYHVAIFLVLFVIFQVNGFLSVSGDLLPSHGYLSDLEKIFYGQNKIDDKIYHKIAKCPF